jgi:hypothetical protein
MQYKQTLLRLTLLLAPFFSFSQTTYLPQGDKAAILLERMEIKGQNDSLLNFSKTRPYSRRSVVYAAAILSNTMQLSKVDNYNLNSLYKNNIEWVNDAAAIQSKKPVLKNFYKTPANLYEVHVKDFDLAINPVLQFQFSKENNNGQSLFLNSRGLRLRGRIANKIGFDAYVTDNQERDPLYVQQYENAKRALPGAGFYKDFKLTGYDYFDARGMITFNVTKYIDVAFGYDKNFIGNGQRSLFLSDFGNNNLFLKLNTKIWRFNYQNLFMELHSAEIPGGDKLLPKKYAVMHHLDVNVTKGLNLGLFEGIVFGRRDRFDFGYLNPVIFYRSIEQQNGSFDNSVAGLDFKANVKKRVQLYGQLLLDEFLLSEIKKNDGWWANKWAIQAGAKYIDVFGIKNLDVQVEMNRVRPFTYGHRDSVANYTHYNQPLAHPLGANFSELIGIVRYQPAPKWLIQAKAFVWKQGLDSSASSFGSNIFLPNIPPFRTKERGFSLGDGRQSKGMYFSFLVSYEVRENLFIDLSFVKRKLDITTPPVANTDATIMSAGIRLNMHRREFEF